MKETKVTDAMFYYWGTPCDTYDENCATCQAWDDLEDYQKPSHPPSPLAFLGGIVVGAVGCFLGILGIVNGVVA